MSFEGSGNRGMREEGRRESQRRGKKGSRMVSVRSQRDK